MRGAKMDLVQYDSKLITFEKETTHIVSIDVFCVCVCVCACVHMCVCVYAYVKGECDNQTIPIYPRDSVNSSTINGPPFIDFNEILIASLINFPTFMET